MSARVIVHGISLLQETYFPSPGVCIEVVSPSILLRAGCLHLRVGHGSSCDIRWINERSKDKGEVEKYMVSSSRGSNVAWKVPVLAIEHLLSRLPRAECTGHGRRPSGLVHHLK